MLLSIYRAKGPQISLKNALPGTPEKLLKRIQNLGVKTPFEPQVIYDKMVTLKLISLTVTIVYNVPKRYQNIRENSKNILGKK